MPDPGKAFLQSFRHSWEDATPASDIRFVVLDCETTGLDPTRDSLVSIGAVAVHDGEIWLDDSFQALLKIRYTTAAVTVHGITREESQKGLDEEDAVAAFLDYLRDAVIVGHHIGHDIATLNASTHRHWGVEVPNRFIDTMDLTLHLEQAGAFPDDDRIRNFSLDALCERFGVEPRDRHTAPGDAFITAQIFLRLLRIAARYGRGTLAGLAERFEPDRQDR